MRPAAPIRHKVADQAIIRDVGQAQRKRFRYPHAGRGKQAEQGGEGDGSDCPDRCQRRCRRHQAEDIFLAVDVRDPPGEQAAPQRVGSGNLVSAVLRIHRDCEAPHFEKTVAPLFTPPPYGNSTTRS
jgi:hypothetical protein